MTRPPGPLDRRFWFSEVDARPLAIFRIGFGFLLLRDWLLWLPDLTALFSADGVFPHGGPMPPYRWSLFGLTSTASGAYLLWGIGLLALTAFTLGLFTRVATVIAWAFIVSLHNRNMLLLTGGDRLVELLLLTSLFSRFGACWSLDAKLFRGSPYSSALGLRFMQLELALLYFMTARLKLRGLWRSGQGIWISLQHSGFLRPPGELLLRFPALCKLLNYVVMGLEAAFPFLAFSPVARKKTVPLALACSLIVQLGILSTMRLGSFTLIMIWMNALWIEPEWLDWLLKMKSAYTPPALQHIPLRQWTAAAVLTVMIGMVSWDFVIGSHVKMPTPMRMVYRGASLEQLFELFGVAYDVTRWEAIATKENGETVDVLEDTAPGLRPVSAAWTYDPWFKMTFAEQLIDRPSLAQWMCRRYAEKTGTKLRSLTLIRYSHAPSFLNQPVGPEKSTRLWSGPCPQHIG